LAQNGTTVALRGSDRLHEDLRSQGEFLADRVPVYGRLLDGLVRSLDHGLAPRLEGAWQSRTFRAWYERPLLLLAALRDDALREGPTHPLHAQLVGGDPRVDAAALTAALDPGRAHLWHTLAHRHMQTNEPTRAVAWLWPAHLISRVDPGAAIALYDIGASAGLNLVADKLPPVWTCEEGGDPLALAPLPPIVSRTGFDLRPLDVRDPDEARWLRACIWPGQTGREARLAAAIEAFRALDGAPDQPTLHQASAGDVPGRLPTDAGPGRRSLAYQTIMRDYLDPAELARYQEGMRRWLSSTPPGRALWVELEVTPEAPKGGRPAAITAHVHTAHGDIRSLVLAHCEPHPRVVQAHASAEAALVGLLRAG
jgi:hypothetical protein